MEENTLPWPPCLLARITSEPGSTSPCQEKGTKSSLASPITTLNIHRLHHWALLQSLRVLSPAEGAFWISQSCAPTRDTASTALHPSWFVWPALGAINHSALSSLNYPCLGACHLRVELLLHPTPWDQAVTEPLRLYFPIAAVVLPLGPELKRCTVSPGNVALASQSSRKPWFLSWSGILPPQEMMSLLLKVVTPPVLEPKWCPLSRAAKPTRPKLKQHITC